MLYEIHMLKNYPPVNLNRDESGAPKSCMFGGTTRGRNRRMGRFGSRRG